MALNIREYLTEKREGRRLSDYELTQEGKRLTADIIRQSESTDRLVSFAEGLGSFLANRREGISTSQIRNIFGEVKKIEMEWGRSPESSWVRLQLLRPKLAYTAKKSERTSVRGLALKEVLSAAILCIEGEIENFQRVVNFFEAILAYHRAYGGQQQ